MKVNDFIHRLPVLVRSVASVVKTFCFIFDLRKSRLYVMAERTRNASIGVSLKTVTSSAVANADRIVSHIIMEQYSECYLC